MSDYKKRRLDNRSAMMLLMIKLLGGRTWWGWDPDGNQHCMYNLNVDGQIKEGSFRVRYITTNY